ncbi:MAG: hypothetical protein R3C68_09435 [Myxococcota bacterium]
MNVACIFPGHGGLSVGVGKCLFDRCDTVRRTFEEADDVLHYPLTRLMLRGPQATLLRSEHAQAALLTLSTALHRAFMRRFVQQRDGVVLAYAGYSLGEFTALVASGAIGFASSPACASSRSLDRLVRPEGGAMAVVLRTRCGAC